MKRYIRNLIGFIILFLISFTGEAKASEPEFFATKEAAAAYVREQMVLREEIISFSMEISYNEQIFKEILLLAVDHETAEEAEQGDYLRCHYGGFDGVAAKQEDTGRYLLTYTIIYYTTYEQERQVTQKVGQILNGLGIGGQSAYEKVRSIYGYVCENVKYDASEPENDFGRFTAYNALFEGKAVCQGFAALLHRMLLESGVESRVITGTAEGETHAWNIVKLDGAWYNLDASWDTNYEAGSYRYFLQNMEDFAGHTRNAEFITNSFLTAYPMAAESHHNWGVSEVIQTSTCVIQGMETARCTDCTEILRSKLALAEHDWQKKLVEATCTDNGRRYLECSVCQKVDREEKLEKLAHVPGPWILKKSATCAEKGFQVRYCTVCGGNEESEEIEPTEHTWKTIMRRATIFLAGYIKRSCEVCKEQETEVLEKLPSYVTLNTGNVRMQVGTTTTAIQVETLTEGDSVVKWTSSNKKVAVVNRSSGKIRAKSTGKTDITVVTKSGATAKIRLTVQKKVVKTKKITFAEATVKVKKGSSLKLKIQRIPVTANDELTFTSSRPNVVKVTKTGVVKALKKGTAIIKVKTASGKQAKCKVKVQ